MEAMAQVHRCMICTLPQRELIESWRLKDGLTLKEIRERMAGEMGIEVSLSLVGKHFNAVRCEVDSAVVDEVRQAATAGATDALSVFPHNVEVAQRVLNALMPDGEIKRPQFTPYVAAMLKEARESALALLRYTPADPAQQMAEAASTWAGIATQAAARLAELEAGRADHGEDDAGEGGNVLDG